MSLDEMHCTVWTPQQAGSPIDDGVRGKFNLLPLLQAL
jgi:hypothetical protein